MEKETNEKKKTGRLAKLSFVLLFAIVVVVGLDGYFNRWDFVKSLLHWNTLELTELDGATWKLKAKSDFQLVKINQPQITLAPETLPDFDQPYRDRGYYRLYFRLSDSSSATLQKLYWTMSEIDTGEGMQRTIEDAERAYRNLLRILRLDTSAVQHPQPTPAQDSVGQPLQSDLVMGSERDVAKGIGRLLGRSPQVLVGVGIGIVATAGTDLLKGNVYLATSKENVFRFEKLKVGSDVGKWEGKSIDIIWAFANEDTVQIEKGEIIIDTLATDSLSSP